jgi:flavin-binding protein dodecin
LLREAGPRVVRLPRASRQREEEDVMPTSVYKVVEIVGSSPDSWEKAAQAAVEIASKTLRDLRVAEVRELDVHVENGRIAAFRARLKLSFKYEE